MLFLIILVSYSLVIECNSSDNSRYSTVLFSKYAKVAKWGSDSDRQQENSIGHAGQSLWSQRIEANVAENNSKDRVFRQYPVYRKTSEGYEKPEKVPGVGEVIQDRFNVRPYMGYEQIHQTSNYNPPQNQETFNSYTPPPTQKPPVNLYTSPYNSYNPPTPKPNENLEKYPPFPQDSYAQPPMKVQEGKYESEKHETLGPPLSPAKDFGPPSSDQDYDEQDAPDDGATQDMKDTGNVYYPPDFGGDHDYEPKANTGDAGDTKPHPPQGGSVKDAPPKHPPKSIDDVYYPDYNGNDTPVGSKPPMDMMDLSPPDSPNGQFQPHLYDDQHVYEEVPHTSTEPAKKRVSNAHYSYYYLGRKLWYIPLYFSIYFIAYVMILIIKAVARHKIKYKHEWLSAHSRSSRKLSTEGSDSMKTVDEVHRNVTDALDKLNKKYLNFAM